MRRILTYLLAVLLIAALAVPVFANGTTDLVLSMEDGHLPVPGVEFELYRVGAQEESGAFVLTGDFAGYPVDISAASQDTGAEAAALYAFAKKDGLTPIVALKTDEWGSAVAQELQPGLYLIGGLPAIYGGYLYRTEPQLLALPQKDPATGEILQNAVLQVKFSKEADTQQTVSRKVLKIWDDVSGNMRPESVTVHLLKNGSIYSTVTLNAQNQWRHAWDGLEADALWQIAEDVPDGYTVTVEQEGGTILLTNSAPEVPPPETEPPVDPGPGGNIPQTGMILWPIFLLAGLGIVCIAAGVCLRKGSAYES